jgi:hypothetical protein
MRTYLSLLLIVACGAVYAQKPCYQKSKLYLFNKHDEPRLFEDPLGRHPQFPFLQRVNGITSPELFIKSIRDTNQQKKYSRTFKAFDLLLKNSGFWRGTKDLNTKNVRKVYITPGTIGNLGYYNKETDVMNYLYVKLNPAGEAAEGIEAWKLINHDGCFLYILFTCGNAFYPNGDIDVTIAGGGVGLVGVNGGKCCRTITVKSEISAAPRQTDSVKRLADLRMNFYQAHIIKSETKGKKYDTTYELIHTKDTLIHFKDRLVMPARLDTSSKYHVYSICRDSLVQLRIPLAGDSTMETDSTHPVHYVMADTAFDKKVTKEVSECDNNWEISVEAGKSFNSIPRFDDPTQHSQTNGSQFTGTLEISRMLTHWFQLGVSGSYVVLSYQDDVNYPGSTPGTYNTIYLGKPIIPIQLFGKFNFGKQTGFQSSVSISFGYSVPTNGKIVSGNTTLTTNPNLKGDFTAGLKFGVSYWFSCHFGLGASFTGQYFNNKSDLFIYSLYALPIQGGLHFRF